MDKRTQLNINIDETLLKELKKLALSENIPLSVFIRNSLRNKRICNVRLDSEIIKSRRKRSRSLVGLPLDPKEEYTVRDQP